PAYWLPRPAPAERIPIPVPPIIDAPLFDAARDRLEANRRRRQVGVVGATVLLQGLLVCARCGYAYHGCYSHPAKKHPYRYYRCGGSNPARMGAGAACKNRTLNMRKTDDAVWEYV